MEIIFGFMSILISIVATFLLLIGIITVIQWCIEKLEKEIETKKSSFLDKGTIRNIRLKRLKK